MLNSVGLQGPGVEAWLAARPPALLATGARVVVSIWGRSVAEYEAAAAAARRRTGVGGRRRGEPVLSQHRGGPRPVRPLGRRPPHDAMAATAACGRPRWAKLSPNVTDLVPIAAAARGGRRRGRHAREHRARHGHRPRDRRPTDSAPDRGAVGCPGPPSTPSPCGRSTTSTRPSRTCRSSGWVASPAAPMPPSSCSPAPSAVQVGTATFADPRAPVRVLRRAATHGPHRTGRASIRANVGAAHGRETTA